MGSGAAWMLWTLCAGLTSRNSGRVTALEVTVSESSLEVVRGDVVVLPCSFFTSSHLFRLNIIWTLSPASSPESPVQVIVFDHGQAIENPSLIGRVAFADLPRSANIILNDTRVSDSGIYRCMVNNPPETADPGIGELELQVLEPPSLPECQWDGELDVGGSVRLSCSVAAGVPVPDIHWVKVDPEETPLPVDMEGETSGSVQIMNVSTQISGLYRCSASNVVGTENCYVNLAVYTAPLPPSGILQATLMILIMVLLLVALVGLVLWLHRSAQDRGSHERGAAEVGEQEEGYNEIRYTPSLMKRSFV